MIDNKFILRVKFHSFKIVNDKSPFQTPYTKQGNTVNKRDKIKLEVSIKGGNSDVRSDGKVYVFDFKKSTHRIWSSCVQFDVSSKEPESEVLLIKLIHRMCTGIDRYEESVITTVKLTHLDQKKYEDRSRIKLGDRKLGGTYAKLSFSLGFFNPLLEPIVSTRSGDIGCVCISTDVMSEYQYMYNSIRKGMFDDAQEVNNGKVLEWLNRFKAYYDDILNVSTQLVGYGLEKTLQTKEFGPVMYVKTTIFFRRSTNPFNADLGNISSSGNESSKKKRKQKQEEEEEQEIDGERRFMKPVVNPSAPEYE